MEKRVHKEIFYKSKEELQSIREECEKISQEIKQLEKREQEKFKRTLDMYQKARKEWEKLPWYKKLFTNPPKRPCGPLIFLPDNLRRSITLIEVPYLRPFRGINDLPEEIMNALHDISKIFGVERLVEKIKEAWEHRSFYDAYETFGFSSRTNLPYFKISVYGSSSRWGKELTDFVIYLSTEITLWIYEGG